MEKSIKEINFMEGVYVWLRYKKPRVKESTYLNYKQKINSKFEKEFGNMTIEELLFYDFNDFVEKLLEEGMDLYLKDIMF